MTFKVGDRVKIIDEESSHCGAEAEIIEAGRQALGYGYDYRVRYNNGGTELFNANHLGEVNVLKRKIDKFNSL